MAGQMYHGGIRTLSDFNNATKQGTYYYSGGNSNELGTTNYGVLCVFVAGGYIEQLLLGPIVSVRMSYDAGTSWSLWKDFA